MFINTQCSEKELALRVKNVERMASAFSFNVHHKWSLADEFKLDLDNIHETSVSEENERVRTEMVIEYYIQYMLDYNTDQALDACNPIDRAYMRSHGGYEVTIPQ